MVAPNLFGDIEKKQQQNQQSGWLQKSPSPSPTPTPGGGSQQQGQGDSGRLETR